MSINLSISIYINLLSNSAIFSCILGAQVPLVGWESLLYRTVHTMAAKRCTLITCPLSRLYFQCCTSDLLLLSKVSALTLYITCVHFLNASSQNWTLPTPSFSCWHNKVSRYDSGLFSSPQLLQLIWRTRCFIYCGVTGFYFLVGQLMVSGAKLLLITANTDFQSCFEVFHWPWEKWNNVLAGLFQGVFIISPQI